MIVVKTVKPCADGQVKVIGYVRVSTMKQVDSGLGLKAQIAQIEAECDRRGWCLQSIATDTGRSAKTMSRDGIQEAIRALNAGEACVLMVSKQDRASRTVKDVCELIDRAKEGRWAFVDLEMDIDTSDPTGEMFAIQRAAVSQWERKMIGLRTKEALAQKRLEGVALGRPVELADAMANRVRLLRADGLSVRKIAEALNREGIPSATGSKWHPTTVQRILKGRIADC